MNWLGAKAILKGNPILFKLNAGRRAWQIERDAAALCEHYEKRVRNLTQPYSDDAATRLLGSRLRGRGVWCGAERTVPTRVLWVGAAQDQDESGFLDALREWADVTTYFNSEGRYGLHKPTDRLIDSKVIQTNDEELLSRARVWARPGGRCLLLGQMWGRLLSAATLRHIQDLGVVTVNISMDDRLPALWRRTRGRVAGSPGLAEGLDLVLTSSPESCAWYWTHQCPAVYWPMASDPDRFQPARESDKTYDVAFVGARYGIREQAVQSLRKVGIDVTAFGPGWPNGHVSPDMASQVFSRSKVILGIGTVGYSHRLLTLKLRDFDGPMSGALYITHRNPDLCRLFDEDAEIVCYTAVSECVEKVRFFLAEPERRQQIASSGRRRAARDHTWRHRFCQLRQILAIPDAPDNHETRTTTRTVNQT